MDPTEAKDPTEAIESAEPMDPIDNTDPTDPIESTEPLDRIERNERSEASEDRDRSSGVTSRSSPKPVVAAIGLRRFPRPAGGAAPSAYVGWDMPRCPVRARRGHRRDRLAAALAIGFAALSCLPWIPEVAGAETSGATSGATSTVWLCRPGLADDPCTAPLTATVVRSDGSRTVQTAEPARNPPIDCFYVYPTVSDQTTDNANLDIDPEERVVARLQASRFSQVCRVYAPMYPQITRTAIAKGTISAPAAVTAYLGVVSAWHDYLARYNDGRDFVLIGHSQGASLLIALVKRELDADPSERRHLVSAILLGGNVTVPTGADGGGDFQHIPACRTETQTRCVVAYSSFDGPPPADSLFGRVGTSIGAQSGLTPTSRAGLQVLCTNPAHLRGGPGRLQPYFLTSSIPASRGGLPASATDGGKIHTPWVTYPNLYGAKCEDIGGASWLRVSDIAGRRDDRPVVEPVLGPRWGLHLVDVNLALGNLVGLVREQSAALAK